ncbi:MAG: DNA polymerase III subunit alpha [Firmicutes bacterium]|nr:DNA polymerase III subunit alpha [Alicyclobacillaceae bacterium]MCL6496468.1 DNA polymerase III subunit alpha [Bacillota bacterium]
MHACLDIFTGYSLLRSAWRLERGIERLAAGGIAVAGIADWETLAAADRFQGLARRHGLTPWIGVTRRLYTPVGSVELKLYARNRAAFAHLCATLSEPQWEVVAHPDLLVVAPGWFAVQARRYHLAPRGMWLAEAVAPGQRPESEGPWVAAWPVRYLERDDRTAYALVCRIGGHAPSPEARWTPTAAELAEHFPPNPPTLPDVEPDVLPAPVARPPRVSSHPEREVHWLRRLAGWGLRHRFGPEPPKAAVMRLRHELEVIAGAGFSGYFLVVADLVAAARRRGVRVGPGRGSVGGSLVAYCLGITEVNPLPYGLVFERFLNPDRGTPPDIDLDVDWDRRGELLAYLRRRWGEDRVAQIGAYGSLGPRAALREVGRVLDIPPALIEAVMARAVDPHQPLATQREVLQASAGAHPGARAWIEGALAVEGLPHHASVHAAGVVVSPDTLPKSMPLQRNESGWITQWEMDAVERRGWLKLDLLGLRTLAVIAAVERWTGKAVPLDRIDPADAATLRLLAEADTDGVFQLDGEGVRALLRQLRPRHLTEVMDVVALWRPGPMAAVGEYLARRNGGGEGPERDPIATLCRDTYGVLVYQEQVMAVVRELGGYTWREADRFRAAVSKKDRAALAAETARLAERLMARGMAADAVEDLVRRIVAFADYGFNRAHAAAYGLLAYYEAYLKAHHPAAFWAAELSTLRAPQALRHALGQAVATGLWLWPPDVNASERGFAPQAGGIRVGLGQIRGLGLEAAARLVAEREQGGPFLDRENLWQRGRPWLDRRAMEALEAAGALARLGVRGRTAQLDWFSPETPGERHAAPGVHAVQAFGWPWPVPAGPVYVRPDAQASLHAVRDAVAEWAAAHPGTETVVLVEPGRRGRRLPWPVAADFTALQALRRMPGVGLVRRHVEWREQVPVPLDPVAPAAPGC